MECRATVGAGRERIEEVDTVSVMEGRPSVPHRLKESTRRLIVQLASGHHGAPHGIGSVRFQQSTRIRDTKASVGIFVQRTVHHQAAQYSMERFQPGSCRSRQLRTRTRPAAQQISEAQSCSDVEQLRAQITVYQPRYQIAVAIVTHCSGLSGPVVGRL
jgi:hypothetical protein